MFNTTSIMSTYLPQNDFRIFEIQGMAYYVYQNPDLNNFQRSFNNHQPT